MLDVIGRGAELVAMVEAVIAEDPDDYVRGFGVSMSPAELPVPGVLIVPPDYDWTSVPGDTTDLRWTFVCLAPGPANTNAWQTLQALVSVVDRTVPLASATFASYQTSVSAEALPAYLCTYSELVSEETAP